MPPAAFAPEALRGCETIFVASTFRWKARPAAPFRLKPEATSSRRMRATAMGVRPPSRQKPLGNDSCGFHLQVEGKACGVLPAKAGSHKLSKDASDGDGGSGRLRARSPSETIRVASTFRWKARRAAFFRLKPEATSSRRMRATAMGGPAAFAPEALRRREAPRWDPGARQARPAGAERGFGVPASDGDGGSGGAKPPVGIQARGRRAPPERSGALGSLRATAMGGPAGRSPPVDI